MDRAFGSANESLFYCVTIASAPPIKFVLTFFLFWTGVHIVHK